VAALFKRNSIAVAAGLGAFGIVGLAGFALGLNTRSWPSPAGLPQLSAAEVVNFRFPNDWAEAPASSAMTVAYASADSSAGLLDPTPIYPLKAVSVAAPSADAAGDASSVVQPSFVGSINSAATIRSARRSNAVLNESQITSIKRRLNLTPEQERYWPAVAAELRKMEYKRDRTQTAAVDMSKVNVEGLKSAGYPLVMSFNDDQRRELKSLAHLLGLESAVSNF
jgi:hypothetical protein